MDEEKHHSADKEMEAHRDYVACASKVTQLLVTLFNKRAVE